MSRYIDADAVERTLQEMEMITAMSYIELGEEDDDVGEISMPMFTVRNIMKTTPSIDIVRCGECKYKSLYDDGETKYYYCALEDRPNRQWSVDDTDYCSYGEREGE